MKTKFFTATCAVLGAGHFVAQTTADLLMTAEANIAEKRLGKDRVEVMQARAKATNDLQDKIAQGYAKRMAQLKAKKSTSVVTEAQV